MGHLLALQTSVDELVEDLTLASPTTNLDRFKRLRDAALHGLRSHSFLRTNQFEVAHQLSGLEERFRVCHRETLADALCARLDALQHLAPGLDREAVDFHPEVLRLLLDTSDQPTRNARLEDLQDLLDSRAKATADAPPLRWERVAEEDGWSQADADIWASIDYADNSDDGRGTAVGDAESESESESDTDSRGELTLVISGPQATRSVADYTALPGAGDPEKLRQVDESQAWRNAAPRPDDLSSNKVRPVRVTESQVLREALFMLQGAETTLFDDRDCSPVQAYQLVDISWDTYRSVVETYAEAGRKLRVLRDFAATEQTTPHFQVFHDCVIRSLVDFDRRVSSIEADLVAPPKRDAVVSLVAAYSAVKPWLEPLLPLSSIVRAVLHAAPPSAPVTFLHLELLFSAATAAQLAGQASVYAFLARIFLACFAVYVRAVRLWMDEGCLVAGDRLFFVSEAAARVAPAQTWCDRFRLRRRADGELHVPAFLRTEAERIFTAGRSIVVLKQLGRYDETSRLGEMEPGLDYESVFGSEDIGKDTTEATTTTMMMMPFPELFGGAFDRWVESKHRAASETLKRVLFDECGLWAALGALESVYLMKDGAAASFLCNKLFRKLDRADATWNNRYELTMLAQEAFAACLDPHRLSVTVVDRPAEGEPEITPAQARDSVRRGLAAVRPHYRLPWPVQMVITPGTVPHYQAIFTLLLQLRRAATVLTADRLLLDDAPARRIWTEHAEHARYYGLRSRLLWFCTTLHTYVATLVLAPACARLRADLLAARDVDAIVALHAAFAKRIVTEACLGSKLEPIHECILDVFDLAPRLQRAHAASSGGGGDGCGGRSEEGKGSQSRGPRAEMPTGEVLREVGAGWDRGLRFITSGLRGVARATSDGAAAKWDLLAELLETGVRDATRLSTKMR